MRVNRAPSDARRARAVSDREKLRPTRRCVARAAIAYDHPAPPSGKATSPRSADTPFRNPGAAHATISRELETNRSWNTGPATARSGGRTKRPSWRAPGSKPRDKKNTSRNCRPLKRNARGPAGDQAQAKLSTCPSVAGCPHRTAALHLQRQSHMLSGTTYPSRV
jgi:hypothetical protein